MYVAILGRQPELSVAELERIYGSSKTRWFSQQAATVSTDSFDFNRLGGSQKAGRVELSLPGSSWRDLSTKVIQHYSHKWRDTGHKITLGISVYGFEVDHRQVQHVGITIKKQLRSANVSLRLIPNADSAHNTAVSHHNKLGLSPNKIELLIVRADSGKVIVAESIGSQNITAIAARDQARPKTDTFVGMLPPKLARMMVNMAVGDLAPSTPNPFRVLDPFCGTGVVLQESLLLGYAAYGSDLSDKMVDYSRQNLNWLQNKFQHTVQQPMDFYLETADAMTHRWQQSDTISAVVSETYLGQPFSAPPTADKLTEVRGNCNHIISRFLVNLRGQLTPGSPLALAVPAWRGTDGHITHLPLINQLESLGYRLLPLEQVRHEQLVYYRENQVVARQLLLLEVIDSN